MHRFSTLDPDCGMTLMTFMSFREKLNNIQNIVSFVIDWKLKSFSIICLNSHARGKVNAKSTMCIPQIVHTNQNWNHAGAIKVGIM